MRTCYVEGINGSIEVTEKYVFINIYEDKEKLKRYIVCFNEIESVTYKKPTRDTYGYIIINLYTKSQITNTNKSFKIILESIKEKDLDSNIKLVNYLREIAKENKIEQKIEELDDIKDNHEEETQEKVKQEPKKDKEEVIEIKVVGKDTSQDEKKQEDEKKISVTKNEEKILEEIHQQENQNKISSQDKLTREPINKSNIKDEKEIDKPQISYSEEETIPLKMGAFRSIETNKENKQKFNEETLASFYKRLNELKKELNTLEFKFFIISKYKNDTKDKDEVERLIEEINYIVKQLEKIEKELNNQKNIIKNYKNINLENGKVIITNISNRLNFLSKDKIEEYIRLYNTTKDKLNSLEEKTGKLNEKALEEKNEIGLSQEEYEKEINKLYGVKSNRDFIEKYKYEIESKVKAIHKEIETTIDPETRYRIVHKGLSERTKNLSLIASLNSLRPTRNRLVSAGLIFTAGINAIRDIFGYEVKEEHYDNVITKEKYVGFEDIDTTKAFDLINKSKKDLESIIEKCENKYKDYPDFIKLKSELLSVKDDIEKEERKIKELNDTIKEYKNQNETVKVLKLYKEDEN